MNIYFNDFSLYTIDTNYLAYLYSIDHEVFYDPNNHYQRKPFVGILVGLGTHKYFIPLTSKKAAHTKWKLETDDHILITQVQLLSSLSKDSIYQTTKVDGLVINILGAIVMSKMIPVPNGVYSKIDIDAIRDPKYQRLLQKEFDFIKTNNRKILDGAKKIYRRQTISHVVLDREVDFLKLEKAMTKYDNQAKYN